MSILLIILLFVLCLVALLLVTDAISDAKSKKIVASMVTDDAERIEERINKMLVLSGSPDVDRCYHDQVLKIRDRFIEVCNSVKYDQKPVWFLIEIEVIDLNNRLWGVELNVEREIKFASDARSRGPKLYRSVRTDIQDFSSRHLSSHEKLHLSYAKKYFVQAEAVMDSSASCWPKAYQHIINAEMCLENMKHYGGVVLDDISGDVSSAIN